MSLHVSESPRCDSVRPSGPPLPVVGAASPFRRSAPRRRPAWLSVCPRAARSRGPGLVLAGSDRPGLGRVPVAVVFRAAPRRETAGMHSWLWRWGRKSGRQQDHALPDPSSSSWWPQVAPVCGSACRLCLHPHGATPVLCACGFVGRVPPPGRAPAMWIGAAPATSPRSSLTDGAASTGRGVGTPAWRVGSHSSTRDSCSRTGPLGPEDERL